MIVFFSPNFHVEVICKLLAQQTVRTNRQAVSSFTHSLLCQTQHYDWHCCEKSHTSGNFAGKHIREIKMRNQNNYQGLLMECCLFQYAHTMYPKKIRLAITGFIQGFHLCQVNQVRTTTCNFPAIWEVFRVNLSTPGFCLTHRLCISHVQIPTRFDLDKT